MSNHPTPCQFKCFGSLAQLVEQRTFNPLVAGSSPARPTRKTSSKINGLPSGKPFFLLFLFVFKRYTVITQLFYFPICEFILYTNPSVIKIHTSA